MAKFQVGDVVRFCRYSGTSPLVESMRANLGEESIVKSVDLSQSPPTYLTSSGYYYPEDALEPVLSPVYATAYTIPQQVLTSDDALDAAGYTAPEQSLNSDPGAMEREDRPETEAERRYREKVEFRRAIGRIS